VEERRFSAALKQRMMWALAPEVAAQKFLVSPVANSRTKSNHQILKEDLAMTVLTRWEPFREFATLQDRINRVFRDSYSGAGQDEALTTSSFAPAVDVYEDEHKVSLKIEVPGIDEKDIDVRVENNTLTVHGERKIEKEEKEENYRRVERQYGSFTRTFTLPTTVDTENVSATYDKGVLKINLPKKAEAKPKQIKVNIGSEKSIEAKTTEAKAPSKAA
jgi:HSP20 family protein